MKIFIAASWLKLGGGVTRTLFELLKRIDYSKYSVTLMLMEFDPDMLEYLPEEVKVIWSGDSFQTAGTAELIKGFLKKGKFLTAVSYIINLIEWKLKGDNYSHQRWIVRHMKKQEQEYDIAISYAMMNSLVNAYVIDNVKAKKKIMWCHIDMGIYKEKYIRGLEKLYEKYDRINCVSQSSLKSISDRYPQLSSKLHVTYNFIDSESIIEGAKNGVDVEVPEKIKLCTVGRISDQKGIDILVDVAEKLKNKNVDFVWWVVGTRYDDEYNRQIETTIKERGLDKDVLLLGEKNPPFAFMKACDVYVQPSKYEGYCTTTNEARILCKPIVTTCVSGADEQFTDGVNGFITEISADAVLEAVYVLISSPEKRAEITQALENNLEVLQQNSFERMIL